MCLIALGIGAHPRFPLILAANRDEFYARPTAAAAPWEDAPYIIAGRDLREGGTWLGATRDGRWAAVTNVRDASLFQPAELSRGHLVAGYLREPASPAGYVREVRQQAGRYGGFNLLVGDEDDVVWCANRGEESSPDAGGELAWSERVLGPGIYGMSNHLLDTPWPKVVRIKHELVRLIASADDLSAEQLLELLLDRTFAAEHELPDTGVGAALERTLSAAFIATPGYGTRSSTALLRARDGRMALVERSYTAEGRAASDVRHEWLLEASP